MQTPDWMLLSMLLSFIHRTMTTCMSMRLTMQLLTTIRTEMDLLVLLSMSESVSKSAVHNFLLLSSLISQSEYLFL